MHRISQSPGPGETMTEYKIELSPIAIRATPAVTHSYACDFLAAEAAYSPTRPFSPVSYYLVCHALDLLSKAHLMLKGRTENHARFEFKHDLSALLAEAEAKGLADLVQVSQAETAEVGSANQYHAKKGFEYSPGVEKVATAYPGLPDLGTLRSFAERLRDALRNPCLSAKPLDRKGP